MTETAIAEAPLPELTETDRAQLIQLLDSFLSTGQERSMCTITEVQDLALDMRLILSPVVKQVEAVEPVA